MCASNCLETVGLSSISLSGFLILRLQGQSALQLLWVSVPWTVLLCKWSDCQSSWRQKHLGTSLGCREHTWHRDRQVRFLTRQLHCELRKRTNLDLRCPNNNRLIHKSEGFLVGYLASRKEARKKLSLVSLVEEFLEAESYSKCSGSFACGFLP